MATRVNESATKMDEHFKVIAKEYDNRIIRKDVSFLISAMGLSIDGSFLIVGDTNGNLYKFDSNSFDIEETLETKHEGAVKTICMISNSEFITGGADGKIIL